MKGTKKFVIVVVVVQRHRTRIPDLQQCAAFNSFEAFPRTSALDPSHSSSTRLNRARKTRLDLGRARLG